MELQRERQARGALQGLPPLLKLKRLDHAGGFLFCLMMLDYIWCSYTTVGKVVLFLFFQLINLFSFCLHS